MYNNLLSKKSKKAISALLASALVISAAPVSVAEAAVTKTYTLGVGKTSTKTVSATIKSVKTSKKSVVAVKKVAKKKFKLTAKKAGKATVTVKYGKKTLKATVKVGATKISKKAFNASMKVNETQKLKINATNGKKDTIQWSTSDANVVAIAKTSTTASVNGNTSVVATAVAAGTASVTAKSKFTGKKATFAITVVADTTAPTPGVTVAPTAGTTTAPTAGTTTAPTAGTTTAPTVSGGAATTAPTATPEISTGVSAKVQNQIPGYDNVVLVNDNAIVTVTVKDDAGKPMANKTVIMSAQKFAGLAADDFEVKGNTVAVTNEKGEASFVIGNKTSDKVEITSAIHVGSAKYVATVVGENKAYSGYVGFAAIIAGDLDWDGDDDKGAVDENKADNLVPGANAKATGDYNEYSYSMTSDMNGANGVQYIGAQQVSSAGTTEHQVTFSVNPMIIVPAMASDNSQTKTFEQEVNAVSGTYGTYDVKTAKIVMKEDMSQLQYATLNFNSVQLSKYTKMTIQCFADEACTKVVTLPDGTTEYTIAGEADQKGFSYQIPKNNSIKAIQVTITSEGQVQTNRNAGFDIKNITGVYDSQSTAVGARFEPLSTAKITWEAVTPSYSEIKELTKENATKLGIEVATGSSFTYQVPVFPYTGNAVIKEYDANGALVKYYVAPTERKDGTNTTNTNDIIVDSKEYSYKKAYQVSEEEALTRILTGVTQNGNAVTANSEKVGSTTLQGTITIDGLGSNVLNAATSKVYTSVHWNPIPNAGKVDTVVESEAAIALAGQKMSVYAQLTDKNGNAVSLAGKSVTFKADAAGKETDISTTGKVTGDDAISVIDVTKTDVNGKAKLVVSSAIAEELINVRAEVEGDEYNVVLTVGSATTASNKVDLYWVDANLAFTNSVRTKDITPETVMTANNTENIDAKNPTVGTPWEYGFKTVGDALDEGILKGYSVDIDGLKIQTVNYEDNKGKYTEVGNGKVAAESIYDNKDRITAKLGADSVGETVTFTATKVNAKTLTVVSAGEGTPNINAKINLSVDWDAVGTVVDIMAVEGTSIGDGDTTMYIKVTDNNGVNPLVGKKVIVKTNNENDTFVGSGKGEITVTTNGYGIAEVTLKKGAGSTSSIITANVENTDQIASKTINWVAAGNEFAALRARMADTNKVEVTFNNEIYAGSVNANEFELTGKDASGKTVTYSVKDATVSGTKVILTIGETLGAGEYTVAVKEYVKDEVKYNLVDEKGMKVTANAKVNFYSTKAATYDVSAVSGGAIKVTNVNSPVVTTEGAIKEKMVVTVNGKVVDYTATQSLNAAGDVVVAYEITGVTVKTNDVVRVCYMGAMESVTVK